MLVLDLVVKLLKMLYRQPDFQLGKSFAVGLRAKGPLPPLAAASPGHNLPALAYLHIHAFLGGRRPPTARHLVGGFGCKSTSASRPGRGRGGGQNEAGVPCNFAPGPHLPLGALPAQFRSCPVETLAV